MTVEALAATTAGIRKINQGHISECSIPLPPLAEQRRIVAKVDELMALVDATVRPGLHAYLATVARGMDCECYRTGGVADHVHLAIRLSRT